MGYRGGTVMLDLAVALAIGVFSKAAFYNGLIN